MIVVWPPNRGLSPRVRGNLSSAGTAMPHQGSIPACAGEPVDGLGKCGAVAVYPRVCGGTDWQRAKAAPEDGLSPRVRGNQPQRHQYIPRHRSIPACAGEPPSRSMTPRVATVYPRVCGGTRVSRRGRGTAEGLSPRVRGNPPLAGRVVIGRRSIPACAGEPSGW